MNIVLTNARSMLTCIIGIIIELAIFVLYFVHSIYASSAGH